MRIYFPQLSKDTFYTQNTKLGTCMVELTKPSSQAEIGAQKLFFHLNNILNVPVNFKKMYT